MVIKCENIQCTCTKKGGGAHNETANIECRLHVQLLRVPPPTGCKKINRGWLWDHTQCTTLF